MGDVATVLGVGIGAIILLMIAWQLDKRQFILKILTIFFSIFLIIILAKATLDVNDYCETVINETTVTGNVTSYTYMEECRDRASNINTQNTFYNLSLWFFRVTLLYAFIYGFWLAGQYFKRLKYGKT